MKYLKLQGVVVVAIIDEENTEMPGVPIDRRYPASYLAELYPVPEDTEVGIGWQLDLETGTFAPLDVPAPPPGPSTPPEASVRERLVALEAENRTLKSTLEATAQSNAFLETCTVEMAGIVYA